MLKLDRQERYRQRYRQMRPGYRPALDVYIDYANRVINSSTALLDAGCGEGVLTSKYQPIATKVVGVDRYLQPIKSTVELNAIADADLNRLPFPDSSFDVVMSSWVLEHLQQPEVVFREIARVLRPGGHFLFITPNAYNYLIWARRLVPNNISTPLVDRIYGRGEDYIFSTYYRANTRRSIETALLPLGFTRSAFDYVSDPTYTAFNEPLFRLSALVEGILGRIPQSRVHLVGWYTKVS
jgi:SAM-dependent methyltransferase